MSESISPKPPPDDSDESRLKIYFLPNLLTAAICSAALWR